MRTGFWERFRLDELNAKEWEALCDGCGKCCLVRQVDTHQVRVYNISCELLDVNTSRCTDYTNRLSRVPNCHTLTPDNVPLYDWLPESCAYRRLHKGLPLAHWHPLLTGSRQQMRELGVSVDATALPISRVPDFHRHRHLIKVRQL